MDDSEPSDGPELNKVGCFRATASWPCRSETHNLMGVRIWGQKAFNHGHQALQKLAESKIQLITLIWYLH